MKNTMSITLQDLKSHLWNCAEILRGSAVDRTDWKAYILPLLFFKRICDVWDDETAEAAQLFGDVDPVDFPEVHRFKVPSGCHWREVRETPLPEAITAFKTALAETRAADDRLRQADRGGVALLSKDSVHLSQQELESYLWGAANLLRGLIDAGDYKQYIFPLLFFKRLSDVWDEDYQAALAETGDMAYARATADDRFAVPDGAHWSDIRNASWDVGRALLEAYRVIEASNPERLTGVFGSASWTDKAQMPDETLKNLIEHFSQHTLSLASVPEDELGNAYEYLIKQFADDSGHTAQEFYTNRTLVHLMTQILEPQAGKNIYDPTVGTGGMLISALAEVKRRGGDARTL